MARWWRAGLLLQIQGVPAQRFCLIVSHFPPSQKIAPLIAILKETVTEQTLSKSVESSERLFPFSWSPRPFCMTWRKLFPLAMPVGDLAPQRSSVVAGNQQVKVVRHRQLAPGSPSWESLCAPGLCILCQRAREFRVVIPFLCLRLCGRVALWISWGRVSTDKSWPDNAMADFI